MPPDKILFGTAAAAAANNDDAGIISRRLSSATEHLRQQQQQRQYNHTSSAAAAPVQRSRFAGQRSKSSDKCGQINAGLSTGEWLLENGGSGRGSSNVIVAGRPPVAPPPRKPFPPLRHSLTFHGAEDLHTTSSGSGGSSSSSVGDHINNGRLFGGGSQTTDSNSEKVFLEHQLHSYSEQLKSITESVRRYSEQAKLLSDIRSHRADKQQQQQQLAAAARKKPPNTLHIDASAMHTATAAKTPAAGKQSSVTTPLLSAAHDVITPSHQLRVFLDNIRCSMRDPSGSRPDSIDEFPDDNVGLLPAAVQPPSSAAVGVTAAAGQTPSDQLHSFLDAIRSNYMHGNNGAATTAETTAVHRLKERAPFAVAAAVNGNGNILNGHKTGFDHDDDDDEDDGGRIVSAQSSTLDEMSEHFVNGHHHEHDAAHEFGLKQRLNGGGGSSTIKTIGGRLPTGAVDVNMHKLKSILHACRKKCGAHVHTNDAVQFLRDCIAMGPQQQHQRLVMDLKHTDDLRMLLLQPQYESVIIVVNRIQLFIDAIDMQEQLSEVILWQSKGVENDLG